MECNEFSETCEIVADVFRKWYNSIVKDTKADPYIQWLDKCFQGVMFPARLNWIMQSCKRKPLRETMSKVFKKIIQVQQVQTASTSQFDESIFWNEHAESLEIIDTLMEYVWEHFNSGHWKDTPSYWRQIYSILSCSKVMLLSIKPMISATEIVKVCDIALLIGTSQLHLSSIFSEIAERLNRMLSMSIVEEQNPEAKTKVDNEVFNESVERSKCNFFSVQQRSGCEMKIPMEEVPSLEQFMKNYFEKLLPVHIQGGMKTWPAVHKWSPQYIAKIAGSRTVPVEIGSTYIAKDWTQKLMTIHEFVNMYMAGSQQSKDIGYLAQHQLLDQVPELKSDIEVPEYCLVGDKDDIEINTWFGPAGTVTPTHFDAKHNILTQVFGSKLIILFPTSETKYLYPHSEGSILFNTSQVNIEDAMDYEVFPEALKASYYVVFLKAGDMLYIPPKCWHFVRSLSPSFSLSFWFE